METFPVLTVKIAQLQYLVIFKVAVRIVVYQLQNYEKMYDYKRIRELTRLATTSIGRNTMAGQLLKTF